MLHLRLASSSTLQFVLAALLLGGMLPAQQVVLDDAFENGNLDGWSFDGTYHTVNTNNPPGTWQWLHFRATGVLGQCPRFRTNTTSTNDVYRSYHRMVWREAGSSVWHYMDSGAKPGDGYYYFENAAPFTQDVVYIAYWYPYTYSDLQQYLSSLLALGSPHLRGLTSIGTSSQGRLIQRYEITDTGVPDANKHHVVLVARQHGCESLGNHALEALCAFLLSADPEAVRARQQTVFHVYPMANPDAVFHGWTRNGLDKSGLYDVDFNRDWLSGAPMTGGLPSASFEVDSLRNDIAQRTGGHASYLIDIHSHPKGVLGHGWYWWTKGHEGVADALVTAAWDIDLTANAGVTLYSWPLPQRGGNSTTAENWAAPPGVDNTIGTLDGIGLTLEPIAAPFGLNPNLVRLGAAAEALGRALSSVLDGVGPPASTAAAGAGCPGSVGTPQLIAHGAPVLGGTTFSLEVAGVPPSGVVILCAGFSDTVWGGLSLPLDLGPRGMPSCDLHVSIDLNLVLVAGSSGSVTTPILTPHNEWFLGFPVYFQAVALDPAANGAGAVVSNALDCRIGL